MLEPAGPQKQLRLFPLLLPFFLIAVLCSNQPSQSWVLFPDFGQRSQKVCPPISSPNTHACRAVPLTTPLPRRGLCCIDAAGDGPPSSWGRTMTRLPWFSSPQASAAGCHGIPLRRLSQGRAAAGECSAEWRKQMSPPSAPSSARGAGARPPPAQRGVSRLLGSLQQGFGAELPRRDVSCGMLPSPPCSPGCSAVKCDPGCPEDLWPA